MAVRESEVPTPGQLATRERVRKWQQEHREQYLAYLRLPFHIDHDHDTGVVRGLLHARCNQFAWKSPNYKTYIAGWV